MTVREEELLAAALAVRANAYVPYSKFPVGAAILPESGRVFAGCDLDNASYPLTSCAKANATGEMIGGGDRKVVAVLMVRGAAESGELCTTYEGCCPRHLEFSDAATTVLLAKLRSVRERFTLHDELAEGTRLESNRLQSPRWSHTFEICLSKLPFQPLTLGNPFAIVGMGGAMADSFVGGPFRHDIFISYSHGDPAGEGDSNLKQWSTRFWEELRRDFRSFEDMPNFNIFFDSSPRHGEGLDPFDPLDKSLEERAARSAILLTLVSPFYMLSHYCAKERDWWIAGQAAEGYDPRGRIAPAIIWGIPQRGKTNWPDALKEIGFDQTGVRFFDPALATANPKPFGWPGIGERITDERFHDALQSMVSFLRHHLKELHERVTAREAAARIPAFATAGEATPSIYLHGRSDNAGPWEQAADTLLGKGYTVFPDEPEPVETDTAKRQAIRERRVATMATCDALLLVAPEDSRIFSEELTILGRMDRGLAIDRAERELGMPGKQLPGAVIDQVSDPGRARRREMVARNMRLGWFSQSDPDWTAKAGQWLVEAVK